jgi:CelD/BcsL family acetyltransferase involved in cellulose biosynthesis
MTLEIRTHHSRADLAALAPGWDEIVAAAPRPSPYLLAGWIDEWLGGPGADATVAAVSAHRDGRLVGLLPTCVVRRHGLRVLTFLGDRESWCADLLLSPGEPGSTASRLVDESRRLPYDVAELTGLPGSSLLASAAGTRLCVIERVEAPVLDMPEGWDAAYTAKASSQRRARDRKRERQLEAAGAFEQVVAESSEAVEAVFDEVLVLHELRWGGRRDGSEFGTPAGARAQRTALRRLADAGHAGIMLLRLDGRPIGFQIWLVLGDTMYLHRSGVDPSVMKFSPGLIAMRRTIAHGAAELGTRMIEMQGAGDQYKLDLATRVLPMHDGYGLARNPLGALAARATSAKVRVRIRLRRVEVLRRLYVHGPKALRRASAAPTRTS